ncbi:hypothetical protein [Streptomyces nigrescens]|uniref:hypothetical protein n=1 Tax=Streptomyces nigrescens TaxID=1920 RepID=UPI0036FEFA94
MTTPLQRQLIRQLEGVLHQSGRKGASIRDLRWELRQTGMTEDEVWAIELPIRRRIRSERTGRKAA